MKKERVLLRSKRKVSAFDYNPLYGMITIEFEDGHDKIFIYDIEESFIKGKKREELQLESITVRKKRILVRGNINTNDNRQKIISKK